MTISSEDLTHLAQLSNFSLDESEAESLKADLENIVAYISKLDELDTDGVEPTFSVSPLKNVFREDKIEADSVQRETLLDLTKNELNYQVKVPKVL